MHYYEVLVGGRSYHSNKPLTYKHTTPVQIGAMVSIPVRNKNLMGIVLREVSKPSFETKQITSVSSSPPMSKVSMELFIWLQSYYPSSGSSTLQLFMPSSILKKEKDEQALLASKGDLPNPPLRKAQETVMKELARSDRATLLHGETGSGKTRIYAELIVAKLNEGRSSLVLTPEIGLTAQLASQLEQLLNEPVVVFHSQLTNKQKRERWKHIASTSSPTVVVGTRSALFMPYSALGLVVIDEAHEDAYKQSQAPHYDAIIVAAKLAGLHKAKLLLGTATPSVTDYSYFLQKKLPVISMKAPSVTKVKTCVVDVNNRGNFSTSQHLSRQLLSSVADSLAKGEQSLLFLNRRGSARLILCQSCGWEDVCPRCDIPLTFHGDQHKMTCHTCGLTSTPKLKCPECSGADIYYKQLGTKSLVSHVQKIFPDASVARFDADNLKADRLEARYEDIHSGKIQILVGTQMLSKGLDLPKLSVVGVVQADSTLLLPDYSAREKTYQQIHQIIGRVGRGHRDGTVVLQTHNPESSLLRAAVSRDYKSFFDEESSSRKKFLYPPYCYMLRIHCSRATDNGAYKEAQTVVNKIQSLKINASVIGPSPAFKAKTHGKFHWNVLIKAKQRKYLLDVIAALPTTIRYTIDPINLL